MKLYLGTPEPMWVTRNLGVTLFLSRNRLIHREKNCRTMPVADCDWAYDSGGFFVLRKHRTWPITVREYVEDVYRHSRALGRMQWAASMDMMCEPDMLAFTGLTAETHARISTENYVQAVQLWPRVLEEHGEDPDQPSPFVWVAQGYRLPEYVRAVDMLREHERAHDLAPARRIGIGSVCRRENTEEIAEVVATVRAEVGDDVLTHGFGVKGGGGERYGDLLDTGDSQAWGKAARSRDVRSQYGLTCTHRSPRCTWCPTWALKWHEMAEARTVRASG